MSSMGFGFGFRDLEPEGVHVLGQYRLWPYSSPYVGAFSRPGHLYMGTWTLRGRAQDTNI